MEGVVEEGVVSSTAALLYGSSSCLRIYPSTALSSSLFKFISG
jgi:hypothetical protein